MASFENNDLTIINLFYFFKNEKKGLYDEKIIDNFINQCDNNNFWLGGQIKLSQNDFINLELINRVKEINKKKIIEYGEPINSFEIMSVNASTKQLELIEDMIITHKNIIKK
jgi:ligand-binding sensor protein